jgi:hypothetical protein
MAKQMRNYFEYTECVTEQMAQDMAGRLSPLDLREVKAAGDTPQAALVEGAASSSECWAYLKSGRPFVIAGIRDPGLIWMLSARDLKEKRATLFFARRVKSDLNERLKRWGVLGNVMWAKNKPHKRLLGWLGFDFGQSVDVNGQEFISFKKGFADV